MFRLHLRNKKVLFDIFVMQQRPVCPSPSSWERLRKDDGRASSVKAYIALSAFVQRYQDDSTCLLGFACFILRAASVR